MKDKGTGAKSPRPPKELYEPPRLTKQGNIRELTQGGPSAGVDIQGRQKRPVQ